MSFSFNLREGESPAMEILCVLDEDLWKVRSYRVVMPYRRWSGPQTHEVLGHGMVGWQRRRVISGIARRRMRGKTDDDHLCFRVYID